MVLEDHVVYFCIFRVEENASHIVNIQQMLTNKGLTITLH